MACINEVCSQSPNIPGIADANHSIAVAFSKFPDATKTVVQIYLNGVLQFKGDVNSILGTEKPKEYRINNHTEVFSGSYYMRDLKIFSGSYFKQQAINEFHDTKFCKWNCLLH